mmetsp:Transcript_30875/g.47327  ORF Transcript_30875/g.47327 Transcript_30875/m.47327 type:complete len:111 (-) Transcript_30875:170-502(-)
MNQTAPFIDQSMSWKSLLGLLNRVFDFGSCPSRTVVSNPGRVDLASAIASCKRVSDWLRNPASSCVSLASVWIICWSMSTVKEVRYDEYMLEQVVQQISPPGPPEGQALA